MTIDEELNLLDSQLRRLKIEYEVFFNNPTKRPPTDIEWKVLSLLRKFSDGGRMSFTQRFRYNEMAQRYAIYSDLWRKKGRIREEGYRRPQDALLSVQGVRSTEPEPEHKVYGVSKAAAAAAGGGASRAAAQPFTVECSDARSERDRVEKLFHALADAKKRAGKDTAGNLDSFAAFVQKKTAQIRQQYGCPAVEFSVEMHDGDVRLKARAKS
ncbi:MAG TPA: MXAN_5187 C-terminal domain-containing protein [Terriglobales bacterium]|nr:MXAN_5187 C-terminal domain-containing protein [Terriglobales bacterium]